MLTGVDDVTERVPPAPRVADGPRALRKPYLILIGDVTDSLTAKTAFGLRDWIPDDVIGQWRFAGDAVDLGLAAMTPQEAVRAGARSLVIGAAPVGGRIPPGWRAALIEAAEAGLDIVSGLHSRLADVDGLPAAAQRGGAALHDIRRPPADLPVGSGQRRSGRRLLTVGTDCAIGKKYTALAIARSLAARGIDADFRATGQTGILIAGGGIPIDSVVADFAAGAAEMLSPPAVPDHWDIIEGQGSLFHPSYAGIALALLHGSQPDALILCTDARRTAIDGCPGFAIPSLADAIALNERHARLTNPESRCIGISMNTAALPQADAEALLAATAAAHGVPCVDPLRGGVEAIADLLEHWQ